MKHNRLRRTLLWVTSNNRDKIDAALASNADVLCFDLEDGIPRPQKAEARVMAVEALKKEDFKGKERCVRINELDSLESQLDLEAVLPCVPDSIRLPKCESVEYVLRLDKILSDFENEKGLEQNGIEIILMVETAKGLLCCYEMATCCKRISAMGIGMEDMTASLGVQRNYELYSTDLLYARQKLVVSAKAAEIMALDACVLFLGDLEYLEKDSLFSRRNGFDGRSVYDVAHVNVCNSAFTPTTEEVGWAYNVIAAYEDGLKQGIAEIRYEGVYIDPPVTDKAERILAFMEMANTRL